MSELRIEFFLKRFISKNDRYMIFTICARTVCCMQRMPTPGKIRLEKRPFLHFFCEFNSSVNRNMVSASIKIFEKKCAYGN